MLVRCIPALRPGAEVNAHLVLWSACSRLREGGYATQAHASALSLDLCPSIVTTGIQVIQLISKINVSFFNSRASRRCRC